MLIPLLIGLAVSVAMLWYNLSEVTYQFTEHGDFEWYDANANGIVDSGDDAEFRRVDPGAGDYRKLTYKDVISGIDFTVEVILWLCGAWMMMFFRDFMYMCRLRILTEKKIGWRAAFNVIMLWEFASAITPSVIGGSGPAIYFLYREGINVGKSTAIVMVTAMLDELFYVLTVPSIILIIGWNVLFPPELMDQFQWGIETVFVLGYLFIVLLITVLAFAIFINPELTKRMLVRIFKLRWLRRWEKGAAIAGDDLVTASREMRGRSLGFWLKAFGVTVVSWTGRFWVVNFLIMAFMFTELGDHLLIYGRQLVMWVIMLISPTPGSSGVAEIAFSGFLKEFVPPLFAGSIAILWRLFSYYPYLFAGSIILPRWLRRTSANA